MCCWLIQLIVIYLARLFKKDILILSWFWNRFFISYCLSAMHFQHIKVLLSWIMPVVIQTLALLKLFEHMAAKYDIFHPIHPNFNPIELSLSVLKAWVRKYFDTLWPLWERFFDDFLMIFWNMLYSKVSMIALLAKISSIQLVSIFLRQTLNILKRRLKMIEYVLTLMMK